MHSGWMEKRRGGTERAKHRQYSACIRALRYIGRYLACACPMSAVSFISSTIRRLLPAYARPRVSRVPPSSHLSFSVSLIHIRYVRNLAVANSCTNVNAGSGRLYELFQFTSTNCGSFLRFLFFFSPPLFLMPLSRSFLFPSLFFFLSSPCTWPRAVSRKFHICFRFPAPSLAEQEESPGREKRRKGKM